MSNLIPRDPPPASPISTAAFMAWFLTLPTTKPSASGVPWNDGGTLAVSA